MTAIGHRHDMKLNRMQQEAVQFELDRHALVLAGAGSGKTATIIKRAEFLLRNGIQADRILLLTFTRRAAREMITRLEGLCGESAMRVRAGTFHSFCLGIIRRMPRFFDLDRAVIIDRDDQIQLMKLACTEHVVGKEKFIKPSELITLYSYARNTTQQIGAYLEKYVSLDSEEIKKALKIFASYEANKKAHRYLDFDDILVLFADTLHNDRALRERLKTLYDHILVDEMQDTNPIQWKILEGLRDPAKLFCVGDDAQSIYAFRGADFRNVHEFTERIPDGKVLKLSKNYRSYQEILDLANWLLNKSSLKYGKNLIAHRGCGPKPQLIDCHSEFAEADWIVGDLLKRHDKGAPWKDLMVITRAAYAVRPLEAALIEENIPYRFIGGFSLLQAAHVKDLICLLRCALSHLDQIAWLRYLTLYPKIGEKTAAKVLKVMQTDDTWEQAYRSLGDFFSKRPEIPADILVVQKVLEEPARAIVAAINVLSPMQEVKYDKWDKRVKDLELIAQVAERYKTIPAFIEAFTLDPVQDVHNRYEEDEDMLTLITTHSAKGTEAPVCYLVRCESGMYPHKRSLGDPDAEEEERRVLYVAMTRAMNELIITRSYSSYDWNWSYVSAYNEDYILDDLPDSLVNSGY